MLKRHFYKGSICLINTEEHPCLREVSCNNLFSWQNKRLEQNTWKNAQNKATEKRVQKDHGGRESV